MPLIGLWTWDQYKRCLYRGRLDAPFSPSNSETENKCVSMSSVVFFSQLEPTLKCQSHRILSDNSSIRTQRFSSICPWAVFHTACRPFPTVTGVFSRPRSHSVHLSTTRSSTPPSCSSSYSTSSYLCCSFRSEIFTKEVMSPSPSSGLVLVEVLVFWVIGCLCVAVWSRLEALSLLRLVSEAPPETAPPFPAFLETEHWRLSLFLRCNSRTASGVSVSVNRTCSSRPSLVSGVELFLSCSGLDRDSPELGAGKPSNSLSLLFAWTSAPDASLVSGTNILAWLFLPSCLRLDVRRSLTVLALSSLWTFVLAGAAEGGLLPICLSFPESPDTERATDAGGMSGILATNRTGV